MESNDKPVFLGNSDHIFVQSNNFIAAKYKDNMSFWEFLLVAKMCTMINPADTDFKGYKIYIKDLIKFLGIADSGNVYKYILEAAGRLLDRKIVITYQDEENREIELETHLVAGVAKIKRPKKNDALFITLTFLPQLRPFLLQLKSDFTKFDFRNYQFLRTGSSIRLYHILKQYLGRRQRDVVVDIEELKAMLGVSEKYELYGHLKTRVLDEAQRRLAETTDIKFTYDEIKSGKKVTALRFHISENQPKTLSFNVEKSTPLSTKPTETPNNGVSETIAKKFGVSANMLKKLLDEFSDEDIQKAIRVTQATVDEGKIKGSPAGFFVQAVRVGYTDALEEKSLQQKKIKIQADKLKTAESEIQKIKTTQQKQDFEKERDIIFRELANDADLKERVLERIKRTILRDTYDAQKSFEENCKKPSFVAAVMNMAKTIKSE